MGGVAGCAAPQQHTYYPSTYTVTNSIAAPVVESKVPHMYEVIANDANGKSLSGVAVKIEMKGKNSEVESSSCITDENGRCPTFLHNLSRESSMSTAKVEGSKDGYYTVKEGGFSLAGSNNLPLQGPVSIKLKMVRPIDYLADDFAKSARDRELRDRVLRFIDIIRLESILNEAEVMLKGIGTVDFKGKKYLQVKVSSTTQYNNLKLNKYDIGKRIFDDTVRKMLNPLNSAIAAPKAYYGYDIVVYGYSKSFADKYAVADKHEFRFLMPESVVRRYKDKDISGQALLDASVILLNDERIDMKLQ